MAKPLRIVPHSVRSLADLVGASPSTIGDLMTGKSVRVSSDLAQRLSVAFAKPIDELFVTPPSASADTVKPPENCTTPPDGVVAE